MRVWSTIKTILVSRQKGFTLVELLAVIAILGTLATLATISVLGLINKSKEKIFKEEAITVINAARTKSAETIVQTGGICYSLSDLSSYLEKDLTGYAGSVYVSDKNNFKVWLSKEPYIINAGETSNMSVAKLDNFVDASDSCPSQVIRLTINPDGGIWNGTNPQSLPQYGTMTVNDPIKTKYRFLGWTVAGEGSSFNAETKEFTMGGENATLTANWQLLEYSLTINANGGVFSGQSPQAIVTGYTSEIVDPTKTGFVFTGWTVTGANSTYNSSSKLFTMGSEDTIITANWAADSLTCTINSSGTLSTIDSSWYTSVVTLSLAVDNGNSEVSQKGISTTVNTINDLDTVVVTSDTGGTTYYGYIITTSGKAVSCSKVIKKDATPPTCSIASPGYEFSTTMTLSASDNFGLAAAPYSWTSATSGFTTTNTAAGTRDLSSFKAWVKDAVGNVGACLLTCGSFVDVGGGYTDGTCAGGVGMNYYSVCYQWTASNQCCSRTGYYRCGVNSGCYSDGRFGRTCSSATATP